MDRIGVPNKRPTVGIGYIVIPSDVDRDQYIINAFRKEEVCVLNIDGSFLNKVLIDRDCIQRIEFPIDNNNPGSCVVYVNEYVHNQPIIIAVLSKGNENQLLNENEFKLYRKTKAGIVSIIGNADKSQLNIQLLTDNETGGDLYVNLVNKSKSCKLNVEVKGNINLKSTSDFNIDSNSKITLGKENIEHATLGDTLKEFLDDFIDEVSKITTMTSMGVQPILNKAQIKAFKDRTEDILSQLNYLE